MQNENSENSETDLKRVRKEIILVGGDSPAVMALLKSIKPGIHAVIGGNKRA